MIPFARGVRGRALQNFLQLFISLEISLKIALKHLIRAGGNWAAF